MTTASLHARVERLAGGLAGAGDGRRAAGGAGAESQRHSVPDAAPAPAGAMLLPLNWRLTASELQYQLRRRRTTWLWRDDAHAALAGQLSGPTCAPAGHAGRLAGRATAPTPDIDPETPLLLLYTSAPPAGPRAPCCRQRVLAARELLTTPRCPGICPARTAAWRMRRFILAG